MADAIASQTILDGPSRIIAKFTNVSDGTGEAAVTKVDASTFGGMSATSRVSIERIIYTTDGVALRILWGADADVVAWTIPGSGSGDISFVGNGIME